ncbi:collagen-binding domain-containing protein [Streptomyces sp. HMX112]|uniref:collagen-binding domain-containing protein n=1 Tax=Streptomyces sp. HMX112 TaxID=3390850 RepID=UPI003A7F8AB4
MRITGTVLLPVLCAMSLGAAPPAAGAGAADAIGNPLAGNHGFGVTTHGNALLAGTAAEGTVAVGGDLAFGPGYDIARRSAGTFVAPGDSQPAALLVGGGVDFTGSAANGVVRVLGDGYVKIGDLDGSAAVDTDAAGAAVNTRVVPARAGYDGVPRIELSTPQPAASVSRARGLPDFDALFATHRERADRLTRCPATVAVRDGGAVRPVAGRTNVLRLTGAELAGTGTLTFESRPAATAPLVVVVDTRGSGGELSWRTPEMKGLGEADARYILWAFPDATGITMRAGGTLRGSVYAPRAHLTDLSPAAVEGDVVVRSLAAGRLAGARGGAVDAGEMRRAPFAARLECGTGTAQHPATGTGTGTGTDTDTDGSGNDGNGNDGDGNGDAVASRTPGAPAHGLRPPARDVPTATASTTASTTALATESAVPPSPEANGTTPATSGAVPPADGPGPEGTGPSAGALPPADGPATASVPAGEIADTGSRSVLWLLAATAAVLVTTGTVLTTTVSRRRRRTGG